MTASPESGDVVLVPVPRAHLGAVYATLAAAMANDDQAPTQTRRGPADEVLVDERNGSWTEAMVRRLQANLEYPAARAVLDLCSERAPEEVTLQDVVEKTGIKDTQIRAQLGAMTKLCKRLFQRNTWPISVRWTASGRANYSMKPELSAWWLRPDD
jgi:hypothetical protein